MEQVRPEVLQRAVRFSRVLSLLAAVAVCAILTMTVITIVLSRQDATEANASTTENVLQFAALELADDIGALHTMLVDARSVFTDRQSWSLTDAQLQRWMQVRTQRGRELEGIAITDPGGRILLSSYSDVPADFTVDDRDYFVVHRDNPSAGLYVSLVLRNRFTGEPGIMVSIGRRAPDGTFLGIMLALVRLSYLDSLLDGGRLGPEGALSLWRSDGALVLRNRVSGGHEDPQGRAISPTYLAQILNTHHGTFDAALPPGTPVRRHTFVHVADAPLIVSASIPVSEIYSRWSHRALAMVLVTSLAVSAIMALTVLFRRELLRRAEAEAQLNELARADGLTGIANRRRFDERLGQEWRRSYRSSGTMALLMIDVDHFKAFNDTHGHWTGDDLLIRIAATLSQTVHRPGDLIARYGGEEFAAILPDTDREGALRIAERILDAVRALRFEDSAGQVLPVTVSIGACALSPSPGQQVADIVRLADAALYEAKDRGRNCIIMAPDMPRVLRPVAEAS
ncbi:sensor domain-containing diguanylate cyclase [Azorhizobium caulinodans]|nr:sensor domain-containing diguanylate cyclase [Azorhizobium caulinodans]